MSPKNEIIAAPQGGLEIVTREKISEFLTAFGLTNSLEKNEVQQFVEIAQAYNLNPFKKEIYCIPYGTGDKRKLSILTGFEVYLKRAERSGLLDGWKVWTEGKPESRTQKKTLPGKNGGTYEKDVTIWGGDLKACIEIFRKDRSHPFVHEVYFTEYAQDNEIWRGKPQTMIKKVAMAQGFRLCFPDELGGIPYTADELPDHMTQGPRDVTPEAVVKTVSGTVVDAEKPSPTGTSYEETRKDYLSKIAGIVLTESNPKGWSAGEKATMGIRDLIVRSGETQDVDLLKIAFLRATIYGAVRGTDGEQMVKTVQAILDCGETLDALQTLHDEIIPLELSA